MADVGRQCGGHLLAAAAHAHTLSRFLVSHRRAGAGRVHLGRHPGDVRVEPTQLVLEQASGGGRRHQGPADLVGDDDDGHPCGAERLDESISLTANRVSCPDEVVPPGVVDERREPRAETVDEHRARGGAGLS